MRRIKGLLLALAFFAGPVTTGLAHASVAHAAVPTAVTAQADTATTTLPTPMSDDAMVATVGEGWSWFSAAWDVIGNAVEITIDVVAFAAGVYVGIEFGLWLI